MEVWQSARSVPVRRQKRLFDETKEAEKVLSDSPFSPILIVCSPNFASTIVMKCSWEFADLPLDFGKKKFFGGGGARSNRLNYGEISNEEFQTKEVNKIC